MFRFYSVYFLKSYLFVLFLVLTIVILCFQCYMEGWQPYSFIYGYRINATRKPARWLLRYAVTLHKKREITILRLLLLEHLKDINQINFYFSFVMTSSKI